MPPLRTKQVFEHYENYKAAGCPVMTVTQYSNEHSGAYTVPKSMTVGVTGADPFPAPRRNMRRKRPLEHALAALVVRRSKRRAEGWRGYRIRRARPVHLSAPSHPFPTSRAALPADCSPTFAPRELISSEIGMRLIAMLCAPWAEANPQMLTPFPTLAEVPASRRHIRPPHPTLG